MTSTATDANTIARHLRGTMLLALPMIASRVGVVGIHMVDVIVLGRAGAEPLAAYVLGLAIQDSLIAMVIGLMLGVPVLVARETARGNEAAAGAIWRRGLVIGALLGLALTGMLQFAGRLFLFSGQEPALAARAGRVAATAAFAMPFVALFYVSSALLEALHRPVTATVAIAIGNVVNLGLNILLIFGAGPIPALGAVGCALASVITFALLAAGLGLYVRFALPGRARFGIGTPARATARAPVPPGAEQARIGLFSGGSFLIEATAFAAMTFFVGWLGLMALAAHGVVFQYTAATFMIAYGIAGATQVRVSNAWGADSPRDVALAGWTGLGLASLFTLGAAALVALHPEGFVRLFTSDAAVIAAALPVLVWVLLATVFDGGQSVMNNACRGRGDTWVPTALHFGSYWLVMVPSAWFFVFPAGQGLSGIYQGVLLASVVSVAVLALRFRRLSRERP